VKVTVIAPPTSSLFSRWRQDSRHHGKNKQGESPPPFSSLLLVGQNEGDRGDIVSNSSRSSSTGVAVKQGRPDIVAILLK